MDPCAACDELKRDVRTRVLELVAETSPVLPAQDLSFLNLCDDCFERVERGELQCDSRGGFASVS